MFLYLTGAQSSLNSGGNSQGEVNKSLGGYISTNPVPNNSLNTLFDFVSMLTLETRYKETLALGLVNKLPHPVNNIRMKMVVEDFNVCEFKVGISFVSDTMAMEHINNMHEEPLGVEWLDLDFYRAFVDVNIITPAVKDEEIFFEPFGVSVNVEEGDFDGTWKAIEKAFELSEEWQVKRLSQKKFRIERRDETVFETTTPCSYISTHSSKFSFDKPFVKNYKDNEIIMFDKEGEALQPNQALGIWLQRRVRKDFQYSTDAELIQDYEENGCKDKKREEMAELLIEWDAVNVQNYNDEYQKPDYS